MTNITLDHIDPTLAERLHQRASANGRTLEAAIAAMCRAHEAAIATQNTDDFANCGLEIINPWNT